MTSVEPLLTPIRERLQAATAGPWEHDEDGFMGCGQVYTADPALYGGNIAAPSGDLYPRSGYSPKDDMAFIASAPTDMARLLAAVEAVLVLHFAEGDTDEDGPDICFECRDEWPCPTIAAVTTALGGDK